MLVFFAQNVLLKFPPSNSNYLPGFCLHRADHEFPPWIGAIFFVLGLFLLSTSFWTPRLRLINILPIRVCWLWLRRFRDQSTQCDHTLDFPKANGIMVTIPILVLKMYKKWVTFQGKFPRFIRFLQTKTPRLLIPANNTPIPNPWILR